MNYVIDVDTKVIAEKISGILNEVLTSELENRYSRTGDEISAAVKDLIYSHKDEIIDKVVDKAAKEIARKGLPKLLDKFND